MILAIVVGVEDCEGINVITLPLSIALNGLRHSNELPAILKIGSRGTVPKGTIDTHGLAPIGDGNEDPDRVPP